MDTRLNGQVAMVTGAGSGIGRASAVLLAGEGARVAVLSRTEAELQDTVRKMERSGGEGMAIVGDVSDPDSVSAAYRTLLERWGRLDIVVANAGVNGVWAPIEEITPDEWDHTLGINLRGTFLTLKYAVPHLKRQGGSVVMVASVNGTRVWSNSGATPYACSKAAQVAMAKMLALELARDRIRVNVICPGAIRTEIEEHTERRHLDRIGLPVNFPEGWHPLGAEPGNAEQVARGVLFLASPAADHITGTEMWIDGGESLLGIRG